jgi:uncharacterized protein YjiS (DUF1127 family)
MTALDHHTHALAAGSRTADVVARVANGTRHLLRWFTGRHAVNRLCDLSDHELQDIGLTRADLAIVMRTPIGADPTVRLNAIARERASIEYGARQVC